MLKCFNYSKVLLSSTYLQNLLIQYAKQVLVHSQNIPEFKKKEKSCEFSIKSYVVLPIRVCSFEGILISNHSIDFYGGIFKIVP